MTNAWQQREMEHAAELDRVKRKAFLQGVEEGKRRAGQVEGLVSGGRTEAGSRAAGGAEEIAARTASLIENREYPPAVMLYLQVTGQKVAEGAEVLGWDGQGDPGEYIARYQQEWREAVRDTD